MNDQKLLYTIEGDAGGLKKAMAEVQAANRRMTEALTRKVGDIGAFKGAQESLDKLSAALTEAKRRRDFFINSASSGGAAGTKLFAADIARAKQEVLRLAAAMQAQQSRLSGLGQSLKSAGIDTGNLAAAEARLSTSIRSANAVAAAQVQAMQRSAVQSGAFKRSLDDVRSAGDRLRAAFGPLLATLAAGVSVRGLAQAADGYANLQARLKLAARSAEEFAASNDAIRRISSAAQVSLDETATLYVRIATSLKDTDVSQAAFVDTTEAVALALRLSGATAAESSSAMLQFSQAIASGVLRGEELNAVFESAPRLMQALAASLGKPVGELRAMAKEGELTRQVLINGLAAELPKLRKESESLPRTIGGALTDLRNTLALTVGRIDEATGASSSFAKALVDVSAGLGEMGIRVRELLDEDKGFQAFVRAFAGLGKLPFDAIFGDIKIASTAKERITELGAEIEKLERIKKSGFRTALISLGATDKLDEQIAVLKTQIAAFEKFGDKIFKPKTQPQNTQQDAAEVARLAAEAKAAAATREAERKAAARAALTAARQEAAALVKAQEALEKARLDAAAQGLEGGITARREKLDQARKAELIDEAGFIAAKAALDEEGLRNELAALQAQQAKLRAVAGDDRQKRSVRTNAEAELALVEARILSASDKILNINVAATAELKALGVDKLTSQSEFIAGMEQEAHLAGMTNEERERELLLIEAKKLGITDINRLLALQGEIRANANAKQAAEELKRQQDSVYENVQQGVQRAFADGLNAVATGGGGVRGALKNAVDTLRNALSNALAGSLANAFLNSPLIGGKAGVLNIAGSLGLGGKKDGATPASALYVQDVGAAGIAGAAGGEGGGLFSGLGNMLSSLLAGIKAAFLNMVSSIGNALSGAFGGGGSGQNWIGAIASLFGYAEGGHVGYTGPGGKYQPAGVVHAGEYVFSADSVRRLGLSALDNLHRLARGSMAPSMPRFGYAEGGAVNLPGAAAPNVSVSLRNVNHINLDDAMSDYLKTRSGERAILNIIQRNPGTTGG